MFRKFYKIALLYPKSLSNLHHYHFQAPARLPPILPHLSTTSITQPPIFHSLYELLPSKSPDREISNYILRLLAHGELCVDIMDFTKARKKYTQALRLSEDIFGIDYVETALSLHRLGDLEQIEGLFSRSMELYTRAMDILLKDFKANGPFIASLNRSIGLLYKHTEDYYEALGYLMKAVESWIKLEDYEKAIVSLKFALEIVNGENMVGLEEKIKVYELAGDVYTQTEKFKEAEENLMKALKLKSGKKGDVGVHVGKTYVLLGFMEIRQDEIEKGVKNIEKGMKVCNRQKDKDLVIMGRAYAMLGYVEEKKENYIKALELYQTSYEIFMQMESDATRDVRIAKILSYIGNIYFYLNDKGKSLKFFEESIKIVEKENTNDLDFLATLYSNIGTLCSGILEKEAAVEYFEKAVEFREKLNKSGNPIELALLYRKLGIAYINVSKLDSAKNSLRNAREIYKRELGDLDGETRTTEVLIEEIEKRTGGLQNLEISSGK